MNRMLYYVSCVILSISFLAYLLSFFGFSLEGLRILPLIIGVFVVWFFAIKEINRRFAIMKEQNALREKNESFFEVHKTIRKNMLLVVFQGVPIWIKKSVIFAFYAAIASTVINMAVGAMVGEGTLDNAFATRLFTGHFIAFSAISAVIFYPFRNSLKK